MAGLATVTAMWVTRTIDAPAPAVWELLVDTTYWPAWGPTVFAVELAGDRTGTRIGPEARGRVRTVGGVWLPFRISAFDDHDANAVRVWAWRVAGVPATRHRVESVADERCRVGFYVPALAAPYVAVCAAALRRIDRMATVG